MDGMKDILMSKGVWGGIIAMAAGLLGLLGYRVVPADAELLVEALVGVAAAVGGIIAIVGRVVASKKIG